MDNELIFIISGNPSDGFVFVGPFSDPDQASGYAEERMHDHPWWLDTLQTPDQAWDGFK